MFGIGMGSMGRLKGSLSLAGKIKKLFSAGQAGAWYDFGQLSQEYQDSLGVNPVTAVEQPLGLVLDGKTGYARGVNLVIDGNFDVGIAGWIVGQDTTLTHDANSLKIAATAPSGTPNGAGSYPINCEIGKIYEVSASISVGVGQIGFAVGTTLAGTQQYFSGYIESTRIERVVFTATATTHYLVVLVNSINGSQYGYLDNVAAKVIQGSHLIQATAGSQPVLSSLQNLLILTEGLITTYPARGNVIEAVQPIAGFATSVHFNQSGVLGYAYKSVAKVIDGQPYTMSVYIQMDDGGVPVGGNTSGSADFALVISGSLDNTLLIEQVGGSSVYRVTGTFNGNSALNASFGVIKYVGNSARTFKVAGYHVVKGSVSTPYQRVNSTVDYSAIGFPFYAKFDGVDDSMTSATGGGATSGFFWCGGVRSLSATGVFDIGDRVGNTGYFARVAGASAPTFFAGNGTALTSITSAVPLSLGVTSLVTAWDDGTNLNIQVDAGAIATIARPAIAAGGAPFYHAGNTPVHIYPSIYRTGTPLTAAERAAAQAWCKSKAGL